MTQNNRMTSRFLVLLTLALPALAAPEEHYLLQHPAISASRIVFSYAGDLWSVNRSGGDATRLTTGIGVETDAIFSPDGSQIAFTGEYDGNTDVFVMPASGGVPKRLTYHPGADFAVGWTPDGKNVIFRSGRESNSPRYTQLFTVSVQGGLPKALPLPMAYSGAYSADGKRFAYSPTGGGFSFQDATFVSWRRYRGGLASAIWITDFPGLNTTKIPREGSSDFDPVWVGDKIYFLSDRSGPVTLFRYDPASNAVSEVLKNNGYDIRSISGGPGAIVYDQFGELYLFDTKSGRSKRVPVEIAGDFAEVRPHLQDVSREIRYARISPTGMRALFEAHGEILTVPAEKGDFRNISNSPAVMDRQPAWAPDGEHIAYFSDESGLYALHIAQQNGAGTVRKFPLFDSATYYFDPHWSPDSKRLAFIDNKLDILAFDTESGKLTKVDADYNWESSSETAWSPDSKWLAYTRSLPNRLHALFLYSVDSGKSTQVTDGMSDVRKPAFDKDGQYLYFTASTNYGPTTSGLDMSSDEHQVTRTVYALVLSSEAASPISPESDEEKPADKNTVEKPAHPGDAKPAPKPVRVDLANLEARVVPLPLPTRDYQDLRTGKPGVIYVLESGGPQEQMRGRTLTKFDLKTRKPEKLADNIASFDLSADGEKMLIQIAQAPTPPGAVPPTQAPLPQMAIVPANAPVKAGEGLLHLAGMQVRVDPKAEWKQMYHEVWRIERSYFYDPHFHGVDTVAAEKQYEPFVEELESRSGLNYIFQEMLGAFTVGHLRGGGGRLPSPTRVPGGLLGADYEISNDRYRVKRIYPGGAWDPQLRAPLAQPGLKIAAGDYILAVNGQDLTGTDDIQQFLEGTAGHTVVLKVASDAAGANTRDITVTPTPSDAGLRTLAWMEANRKKVDELSGGKLAYVYLPDTGAGGLTNFTRYYFAQTNKDGAVIDERFNSGGQAADYIIQTMQRQLLSYWAPRYGAIYRTPEASILGPKVMMINEFSGSGGDAMPWYFRYTKLGPLIGKRTWGGLVGISQYPTLMDGGAVTSPSFGFFSPSGQWDVENHGVPPDIEVDMDPKLCAEGHDPQLERAISVALDELKKNPPPQPHKPPYPNYTHDVNAGNRTGSVAGGQQ
jgi:tricorn protease